jgi:hypothetical protein
MTEPRQIARATDEHAAKAPLATQFGLGRDRTSDPESSPHSAKFRAVTGGLVGLAVASLIIAIALIINGGDGGPRAAWSSWQPQDGGTLGEREIADHFAPLYRISGVDQLTVVTVSDFSSATAASGSSSSSGSGLEVAVNDPATKAISLLPGNTVAFNLCGIGGANCAITVGTPSTGRLLLLRREALELALYTLKYVSSTDNVVALLPPGHTTQTSTLTAKPPSSTTTPAKPLHIAVLFTRNELKPFLDQPIASTLPLRYPPAVSQITAWSQTVDAALVEQVTARGIFSQQLQQTQDGTNLLVLDPLPPQ